MKVDDPLKRDDIGLNWLLEKRDPPIRYHALHDLLGLSLEHPEVRKAKEHIKDYAPVRKVLRARNGRGNWPPDHTFFLPKWTSTIWQLMLLSEMGIESDQGIKNACEKFLDLHQMEGGAFMCPSRLERVKLRFGEPCITGNMVRTLLVFGYGDDSRVRKAIDWLPEDQLEDGGWNCFRYEERVNHSSFSSTIEPLWAYSEIPRSSWTRRMKRSIDRGAEFLLMHRIYKSDHNHWKNSLPFLTSLHFPMYYYYDVLHGLRILAKLGYADDERLRDAVHLILSKRTPEGKWLLEGDWYREPDAAHYKRGFFFEGKPLVNLEELWEPSKWVTLNCYRALSATGDLEVSKR